jgi:sulfur relay (sulfurtransferase) DsrF/TusC family protein
MDCIKTVGHRFLAMSINKDFSPIEQALKQINVTIKDENNNCKSIDNILSEVLKQFKSMNIQNKQDDKEIHNKYIKEYDDYIEQIYCHERDLLEDEIKNRNILMLYTCNKLTGIRQGHELYKRLTNSEDVN